MIPGALSVLVALLLVVGIYGTVSNRTTASRRNIGIRMALGADAAAVIRSVVARLSLLVGVSVALGVALAQAADPLIASGGVPVGDADPRVLVLVSLLTVATAAPACSVLLRRALRIDPAASLRME